MNCEIFIKSGTASTAQSDKGHPSTAGQVTSQHGTATATATRGETPAVGQRDCPSTQTHRPGGHPGAGDAHAGSKSGASSFSSAECWDQVSQKQLMTPGALKFLAQELILLDILFLEVSSNWVPPKSPFEKAKTTASLLHHFLPRSPPAAASLTHVK